MLISVSMATAALAALGVAPVSGERETITLTPKPIRKWNVILPAETFAPVGSGIVVAAGEPPLRRTAETEGDRLRIDLDGDGAFEALIEGKTAFVTLTRPTADGSQGSYSVRLRMPPGQAWQYSCGGAMVGRIGDVEIKLFDQDLNGSFADYGIDAMIVGKGTVASYLSRTVSLGDRVVSIEVAADGASIAVSPYSGPTGRLDLASGFVSKAKLEGAVVVSTDGEHSFELAAARTGSLIPVGKYQLTFGRIVLGDARATLSAGRAAPFTVVEDAVARPDWGGPVSAEFAAVRDGDKLGFTPWDIWYYGTLGEQYTGFMPLGTSPEFKVVCRTTPEEILYVKFPGNC